MSSARCCDGIFSGARRRSGAGRRPPTGQGLDAPIDSDEPLKPPRDYLDVAQSELTRAIVNSPPELQDGLYIVHRQLNLLRASLTEQEKQLTSRSNSKNAPGRRDPLLRDRYRQQSMVADPDWLASVAMFTENRTYDYDSVDDSMVHEREDELEEYLLSIEAVPSLQALSMEQKLGVVKNLEMEEFSAGDIVITEGDIGDCLYILYEGEVEVVIKDKVVRTLDAGFFGEVALLQREPRTATVRVSSECASLLRLNADAFEEVRKDIKVVGYADQVHQWSQAPECAALLERIGSFDFDTIAFAKELPEQPLACLGVYITSDLSVKVQCAGEQLPADFSNRLGVYFRAISDQYERTPYHSEVHACDVLATTEWFMRSEAVKARISAFDHLISLIAAAVHDVGHPGRNNLYETKTLSPLALRYNDTSVLENMHAATAFETARSKTEANWLELLPGSGTKDGVSIQEYVRRMIIDMVMHTDMTKHNGIISDFKAFVREEAERQELQHQNDLEAAATQGLCSVETAETREAGKRRNSRNSDSSGKASTDRDIPKVSRYNSVDTTNTHSKSKKSHIHITHERKQLLLSTVLHAADVSNACKPRKIMLDWTRRVLCEFWAQGVEEKRLGLPISPLCDGEAGAKSVPQGQLGFIQFVIRPFYSIIGQFCQEVDQISLDANQAFWEEQKAQNVPYETIFGGGTDEDFWEGDCAVVRVQSLTSWRSRPNSEQFGETCSQPVGRFRSSRTPQFSRSRTATLSGGEDKRVTFNADAGLSMRATKSVPVGRFELSSKSDA